MDYECLYRQLIEHRRESPVDCSSGVYVEMHHIVPRCLGGNNNKENLVCLTGREHYVAHKILLKIVEVKFGRHSKEFYKVANAVLRMTYDKRGRNISSRDYELARKIKSEQMKKQTPWNKGKGGVYSEQTIMLMKDHHVNVKGENNPMFGRKGIQHPKTGKKMSLQTRERIGAAHRGKKVSLETRKKISDSKKGENNPMLGVNWTLKKTPEQIEMWKSKISATKKERAPYYVNGMKGKHLKDFMTEEEYRIWLSHHHHLSGKDNPNFGKIWMFNRDTKEIIYVSEDEVEEKKECGFVIGYGKTWWTNGETELMAIEAPKGFRKGRLSRR